MPEWTISIQRLLHNPADLQQQVVLLHGLSTAGVFEVQLSMLDMPQF